MKLKFKTMLAGLAVVAPIVTVTSCNIAKDKDNKEPKAVVVPSGREGSNENINGNGETGDGSNTDRTNVDSRGGQDRSGESTDNGSNTNRNDRDGESTDTGGSNVDSRGGQDRSGESTDSGSNTNGDGGSIGGSTNSKPQKQEIDINNLWIPTPTDTSNEIENIDSKGHIKYKKTPFNSEDDDWKILGEDNKTNYPENNSDTWFSLQMEEARKKGELSGYTVSVKTVLTGEKYKRFSNDPDGAYGKREWWGMKQSLHPEKAKLPANRLYGLKNGFILKLEYNANPGKHFSNNTTNFIKEITLKNLPKKLDFRLNIFPKNYNWDYTGAPKGPSAVYNKTSNGKKIKSTQSSAFEMYRDLTNIVVDNNGDKYMHFALHHVGVTYHIGSGNNMNSIRTVNPNPKSNSKLFPGQNFWIKGTYSKENVTRNNKGQIVSYTPQFKYKDVKSMETNEDTHESHYITYFTATPNEGYWFDAHVASSGNKGSPNSLYGNAWGLVGKNI